MHTQIKIFCALWALLFSIGTSPAIADEKIPFRFCNSEANSSVSLSYASYKLSVSTTTVAGWYTLEPGRCNTLWLWDSDSYTHHFIFSSGGKIVEFSPKTYELFGVRGFGALRPSNKSFCVDRGGSGFEITETIFSSGRATRCVGSEALEPFAIRVIGGGYSQVNINIPAISGQASKGNQENTRSHKSKESGISAQDLLIELFKLF